LLLRSDPEPWDSDPRLVRGDRVERPVTAVVDETEPRGYADDSRLTEESELLSDPMSLYMLRGEEKLAGGVDTSMLA